MHAESQSESQERLRILSLSPKPAWAEVWHLRKILIPRRSITGRLLTGQVWRRHDGRRWIYKKFTEYNG
ncbi:MAG: hypothetical protein J0H42_04830 [Rhizobiales bacterium]|nr:hypothetical protein [Hyphomicrobiales bacterium]